MVWIAIFSWFWARKVLVVDVQEKKMVSDDRVVSFMLDNAEQCQGMMGKRPCGGQERERGSDLGLGRSVDGLQGA